MAAIVEPDVATYEQYIDGEWAGAEDGRTYEVINPSTEEVMARCASPARGQTRSAQSQRQGAPSRPATGGSSRSSSAPRSCSRSSSTSRKSRRTGDCSSRRTPARRCARRRWSTCRSPSSGSGAWPSRRWESPGTSRCPGSIRHTCPGTSCSASRSACAPGSSRGTTRSSSRCGRSPLRWRWATPSCSSPRRRRR